MGESNDSFFENVLLKHIDVDIAINVDLSDTPEKKSASTMRTSTISKTEKYIDNIYDEAVKSELKKEILLELWHRFPSGKKENKHLEEFIQSLNDQISTLKSGKNFLLEELKEKDHVMRILLNLKCRPIENCGTTLCSNIPSGKSSDYSNNNNNNINNNISRSKINDNTSNNKISNNNVNNNNTSNNNKSDNSNINIIYNK